MRAGGQEGNRPFSWKFFLVSAGHKTDVARLAPTENFFAFQLAKELGSKYVDLLLGNSHPMSTMELYLWQRFEQASQRLEQQNKPTKRGRA